MKLNKIYNVIVNDIIVDTSSNISYIIKVFDMIRKTEPTAYIQTCYA